LIKMKIDPKQKLTSLLQEIFIFLTLSSLASLVAISIIYNKSIQIEEGQQILDEFKVVCSITAPQNENYLNLYKQEHKNYTLKPFGKIILEEENMTDILPISAASMNLFHFHTIASSLRTPQQVIGSVSFMHENYFVIDNHTYPRKFYGRSNPDQQIKQDLKFIVLEVFKLFSGMNQKIGIFFKEDDFVLCMSEMDIIDVILKYGLQRRIVSLAYGFGLVYIPRVYLDKFLFALARCNSAIDSCLSSKLMRDAFIKIHPPFAVHKNTKSHINHDEKHKCNWKCFIDCKDAAHERTEDYHKLYLNVTPYFNSRGIGILDMYIFGHCNISPIDKNLCYD